MFEYILKYLKSNKYKRLLVYHLEGFSLSSTNHLAFFLIKNGFEVDRRNKYFRFKNNSNEILFAGHIDHIRGYNIDDFIFFGYYNDIDNLRIIKFNIMPYNRPFRNYYSKNIIFEKFFKKI